jgi:hypothetical protein
MELLLRPGFVSVGWELVKQGWPPKLVYAKLSKMGRNWSGYSLNFGTSLMSCWLDRKPGTIGPMTPNEVRYEQRYLP